MPVYIHKCCLANNLVTNDIAKKTPKNITPYLDGWVITGDRQFCENHQTCMYFLMVSQHKNETPNSPPSLLAVMAMRWMCHFIDHHFIWKKFSNDFCTNDPL